MVKINGLVCEGGHGDIYIVTSLYFDNIASQFVPGEICDHEERCCPVIARATN